MGSGVEEGRVDGQHAALVLEEAAAAGDEPVHDERRRAGRPLELLLRVEPVGLLLTRSSRVSPASRVCAWRVARVVCCVRKRMDIGWGERVPPASSSSFSEAS